MVTLDLDKFLSHHVFAFVLILCRVGCVLMLFPGIAETYVSVRTRMMLAMGFSFLLMEPLLPHLPPAPAAISDLVRLMGYEILIGLFFGTFLRLLMGALENAGAIIALQTGLSNATVLNPALATQSPLASAMLGVAGVVLVFVTGLDHFLFRSIGALYTQFPPGEEILMGDVAQVIIQAVNRSFVVGIELGLPFLVMGLLMYIALGIMQKLMPQVQLFLVILPVQIWGGLGLIAVTIAGIMTVWLHYFDASIGSFSGVEAETMAEEDQDQKTEAPTGKRLDEARGEGRLPISRELAAWVLFVGVLIVATWLAQPMAERLVTILRVFIEMPHAIATDDRGLQTVIYQTLLQVGMATAFIFIVMVAAALAGTMVQTGLFASTANIRPDITRLSPKNGFNRLFSTTALVELVKSFAKMVVLGTAVFFILLPVVGELPSFNGHSMLDILALLHHEAVHLITILLLIFTAIAIADLYYQRFSYTKSLRMTKAEVKDEFKQQEGDPMIKSRLRQIRIEKARKRMMAQVPKADVVVTNPTHYAVALQYDNAKMAAPIVVAKGVNLIADRIREVAEEHNVPLVSNPPLARILYDTVDIDRAIPTQHYRAVAEVISYVYKLKKRSF